MPESIAGRYTILGLLGAGASSEVYRVLDNQDQVERALKILRPKGLREPAGLTRALHREFVALEQLRHPNLVQVHDFGAAALTLGGPEVPWFTMDLIEGQPADRALGFPPDWNRLARLADAVLDALSALHAAGLVHRDITPANILVGDDLDREPPTVWLMDLGLAEQFQSHQEGVVRGTPATLAPETLRGGAIDGRADLYSLGCVIYRLATGQFPFPGDDIWSVLRAHLGTTPTAPRELFPPVPPSLEQFILRLLAKDPAERPASAEEARQAIASLSGRRGLSHPTLTRPLAPAFVGRETENRQFQEALTGLSAGRGAAWLMTAPPGVGRSRLLAEFRLAARLAGLPVLLAPAARAPHRAFGLIHLLRGLQGEERLPLVETATAGAEGWANELARAWRFQPAVLLVDDIQWGDSGSLAALALLAKQIAAGSLPLLMVLALPDRPGDRQVEAALAALAEPGLLTAFRLTPLGNEAAGRMAASMLGRAALPAPWTDLITRGSGGVPLLIEELVGQLVRSGRLGSGPLPNIDPATLLAGAEASPPRSRGWLESAYKNLSQGERGLLAALAVAGGEALSFDDIEGLDPHAGLDPLALDRLLEGGLARREAEPDGPLTLALAIPALAETILEWTPVSVRQILHRRRADQLATRSCSEEEQARHRLMAGDPTQAASLFGIAAQRALAQGGPRQAEALAQEALAAAAESAGGVPLAPLLRIRAEALAATGAVPEAGDLFQRALDRARQEAEPAELAATLGSAGTFLGRTGRLDEGLALLEEALALWDEQGNTAGGAALLHELGRLLDRSGHRGQGEARLNSALSQARRARRPDLEAAILVTMGERAAEQGKSSLAGQLFLEAEATARRGASPEDRQTAKRGRILALTASGRWTEALAEAEEWWEEARRAGNRDVELEATALMAPVLVRLGRRSEAVERWDQAALGRRRAGQIATAAEILAQMSQVLLERGQPAMARQKAEEARSLARQAGRTEAQTVADWALARIEAYLGHPEAIEQLLPHADRLEPIRRGERVLREGQARAALGEWLAAREPLQEACFLARRAGAPLLEEEALLALSEAHLALGEFDRARLALRRVRQSADPAGREEVGSHAALLAAELELGQAEGDLRGALDQARQASRILQQRERSDLLWRAEAARAEAARRLGEEMEATEAGENASRFLDGWLLAHPEADRSRLRERRSVKEILSPSPRRPAPSSLESPSPTGPVVEGLMQRMTRLERLLDINRDLNSNLERGPLLERLLDTAIEVIGAERGFVLLQHDGRAAVELARGPGGSDLTGEDRAASRAVARQVMSTGAPLLSHNALTDERFTASRSVQALRIQSVLAVPLKVRGRNAGALVLDSRHRPGMFGPGEQELALRLADQAGLALGNASLIEELRSQADEIRRLNEKLALKVEEQGLELLEKQSSLEIRYRFDCLVGASPPMQKVYRNLDKILPTEIPVLVTGESGTGKDLIARVLHYSGPRRAGRFVTVNCAALTDTLLESELFGHKKGSFTGADRDRRGLFEQADGGTLFLDEIGEMPLTLQPKLLRALQFGEVRRVGEDSPRQVNVRLVAATNRDPEELVACGKFREDLFYRLAVARMEMAPLRRRLEDLPLLVSHFLEDAAKKSGAPAKQIEPAALRLFLRHEWPGNVRELENEVIKLAAFSEGPVITELDVLENASFIDRLPAPGSTIPNASPQAVGTLEATEIEQIRQALRAAEGNRTRAAEILGIDRSTLYRKLKKLGEA